MSKFAQLAVVVALLVMVTMVAGLSIGQAGTAGAAVSLSSGCCCCPPDCPLCDCTSCADCICCAERGCCVDGTCEASAACTKACCAK